MRAHQKHRWSNRILSGGSLLICLTLAACNVEVSGISPISVQDNGSSGGGGVGGSSTTAQNINRIVSAGPSLSFNAFTGGVNDMALNPLTKLPAVVYYDKGSPVSGMTTIGALKYAYMDSNGSWHIEVIDANYGTAVCGTAGGYCVGAPNAAAAATASILRVAFTSTGQAAVAYVYGMSLAGSGNKQVRFAERSSNGTWTVSSVFSSAATAGATNAANTATVDALKGVTLNFDSSNRPHITFSFYAQTLAGNSFVKYAFRSDAGTWSVSDITASFTAGTITAVTQGAMQSGAAFCPANGMLMLATSVVDAATGAGKPLFVRCTAMDGTGACTTWNTLNLVSGCGGSCFSSGIIGTTNAATRMDLAVDPATQRPILGIYTTANPATTLFTSTAPNACDTAQPTGAGSWGAPQSVGASNEGQNGFRIATSNATVNTNFIVYLDAATTVVANKATGPDGAWLGTGTTIESTTVGAEGVGGAYDPDADVLYTSYAQLPGALVNTTGNDIRLAMAGAADVTNAGAVGSFIYENIDSMMTVFPSTAIPMLDAAKAPNGTVGYAYFYQDSTAADMKLYYGVRGGTAASPVFSESIVTNFSESAAGQLVGSYPALEYDSASNPIVAFFNGVTAIQALQVARSSNGGSTFSVTTVDDTVTTVGQYPSVAVSGTSIGISYYDVTNTGLKFARWTATGGWKRFAVDGMAGTGSCGNAVDDSGKYTHLAFTSTGRPVIAYQHNGSLKIAYATEALTSTTYNWTCVSIESSGNTRGEGIDFKLDSSDRIHLAHFDASAGHVRYVTCSTAIAACISTGPGAFVGELVAAAGTTSTIATRPSIAVSAEGGRYVAHYSGSFQALAIQSKGASDTAWTPEYVDPNNTGQSFTSLAGQYPILMLNSSGLPMAFYRSRENWIRYFSKEVL